MPNGRPGDRPDTDIIVHGNDVYGDQEINEMIREIDRRAEKGFYQYTGIDLYQKKYGWNLTEEHQQALKNQLREALERLDDDRPDE